MSFNEEDLNKTINFCKELSEELLGLNPKNKRLMFSEACRLLDQSNIALGLSISVMLEIKNGTDNFRERLGLPYLKMKQNQLDKANKEIESLKNELLAYYRKQQRIVKTK